jgi:hypothetical protein
MIHSIIFTAKELTYKKLGTDTQLLYV